ncbi:MULTISPECIES: TetR/AcrR family transcriptional regulator [unclassified Achromobacter]|uniref:TetR/AcrR family transcriptional regulator n=1 Tax=unclassified Achromobacter TaxID=2626865 RepID=UPI000B51CC48|nr:MULTISPECIES: TetR/AcrR family transcriptional regulator [unclassified Achromobacter]OWT71399.1 TetR family transcriptional regulator [Achromobacter sp. HZ34]OWT73056.1 TetR family transcriptional regulator [Achromobacter sp. HZ28]
MSSTPASVDTLPPRERILHAAHALFYGQGIRATGVDKIIEAAAVTKVTFYRHYPSKELLVAAYLEFRHERWMQWFRDGLASNLAAGASRIDALALTLRDWFDSAEFRGCAFLNAAAEFGATHPEILKVVRDHKNDVARCLDEIFESPGGTLGRPLTVAIDGAIVHAQMGEPTDRVIDAMRGLSRCVLGE